VGPKNPLCPQKRCWGFLPPPPWPKARGPKVFPGPIVPAKTSPKKELPVVYRPFGAQNLGLCEKEIKANKGGSPPNQRGENLSKRVMRSPQRVSLDQKIRLSKPPQKGGVSIGYPFWNPKLEGSFRIYRL